MHRNSLAAYDTLDLGERARAVLRVFVDSIAPLSDREARDRGGFRDMNEVRPSITHMVQADPAWLEECGDTLDPDTKKTVRLCRPTAHAITMLKKPAPIVTPGTVPDQVKAECRLIAEHIAKVEAQGATKGDLARTFPHIRPADLNARIGRVAAFAAISTMAGEVRGGEVVWHIAKRGVVTLGREPTKHWHVDQEKGTRQ